MSEGNGRISRVEQDVRTKAGKADLADGIAGVRREVRTRSIESTRQIEEVREDIAEIEVCVHRGQLATRDLIELRFKEDKSSRRKDLGIFLSGLVVVMMIVGEIAVYLL